MAVLVRDIMTKPVLTIDINKNVNAAGKIMAKARIDSLIVVKNGKPVGIITDSDIIKKVVSKNIKPSTIKVSEIMSGPLVTIEPDATVLEVSRKMKTSIIKRIPVIEGSKIVGIISTTDIARTTPELVDILEFKLKTKEMESTIKEREASGICDSCNNYSERLTNVNDQWVCESCKEEAISEE